MIYNTFSLWLCLVTFEKQVMYEEGQRGLINEHWRPSVKAPPLSAGGPVAAGAVMTTDEAAMLIAGAAHFYVIQEIKFGHDDMFGGSAFGLQVYERARDELKPKHKAAFDVAAIVEILARTNGVGPNLSWP